MTIQTYEGGADVDTRPSDPTGGRLVAWAEAAVKLADAVGKNEVFVGRIRRDDSIENGINLWCVADNVRKGAATNAVQIAKYMMEHDMFA